MGILLYAKVIPLYNILQERLCCCLQVNYIVYKYFDRSLHIESLDPTCVQISDMYLFQFLRYKLKNENDKKNKN